jgi:hypothetical protein
MLFGYPVEMLCTYQYSLVSLIPGESREIPSDRQILDLLPSGHDRLHKYSLVLIAVAGYATGLLQLTIGLLLNLNESGSPELDTRQTRTRPTSLRTSDRSSLLRYMGLRECFSSCHESD